MASKTPAGLGTGGRKLWREITGAYDLRADELRVLEDACREADLIAILNDGMADDVRVGRLMVRGSQGQDVINPIISELRQHRGTLASLLRQLKLPDQDAEASPAGVVSTAAREVANARWQRGA